MARVETEAFNAQSPPGGPQEPRPNPQENPEQPRSSPRAQRRGQHPGAHARSTQLPDISRLLIVAAWMRSNLETTTNDEADAFRRRLKGDLQQLQDRLSNSEVNQQDAELCVYLIACAIDNAALSSGFRTAWAGNQLAAELFEQAHGGEEFFQRVRQLVNSAPGSHPIIVFEVALLCLVCGFEGMLAVHDNRERSLAELKRTLLQLIEEMRSIKQLATHRGEVSARPYIPAKALPVWVTALVALAIVLGSLAGYQVILGHRAQLALEAMSTLSEKVPVYSPPIQERPATPPPKETWPDELREYCQARSLECNINDAAAAVILSGPEAFASASAELKSAYLDRIGGLAAILDKASGNIQIHGHSDAKPIRTFRYQNNTELSRDRADSVSTFLATGLKEPSRLFVKGYGETNLRCKEASAECDARNRRVEVIVERRAGA